MPVQVSKSPFVLKTIKTEFITVPTQPIAAIIAGDSPHSPIIVLTNISKNIEFNIITANFIQWLQIHDL